MKTKVQKQFVIYSRKSKFTGKGESVENQVELCRQYIVAHYTQEDADAALIYEDEGFSGGNLERPQFKKMMQDSHKKQFAAIVVYRLDRISRNIGDFAGLIQDLGNRKIDFISIREQFDTSSPMGRAMMYIASVFSQLERETIAERIRDNMNELAKTGRWLGGTTPIGYESESYSKVSVDGKVRKACKLKGIPEEINLVKLIYDKFMETGSLTKVDQFLLEKRYKTRQGNDFTRFAIRNILTNPVYMMADEDAYCYLVNHEVELFSDKIDFDGKHGIMAYNRTLQRAGKTNQTKPMEEWVVSVGKHEGVISGAIWAAIQEKLELNKSKNYRKPRSNIALLSGLLICSKCGEYMRPKMTNRETTSGQPIYTYICSMKERSKGQICNMKNINGNLLDEKVIEVVKRLGKNSDDMAKQVAQLKKVLYSNQEGYDAEVTRLKAQIEENETNIKALVNSLAKATGTSAESYIMEQIDELHEKSQDDYKHLEELQSRMAQHELTDVEFDTIKQMLSSFSDNIDNYSVEQKRSAIRNCIKRVVWDGENVHLYLFGQNEDAKFQKLLANSKRGRSFGDDGVPSGEDSE